MNRYLIFCLLLFINDLVVGQSTHEHPWDTISFKEIVAGKETQRTLKDYRGQVVILDFWNIWCSNCIADMPKLDSLQSLFQDELKILSITKDSNSQVRKLFERQGMTFNHLAFVMNDFLLSANFPYKTVPHHVWLDREGNLMHTTYAYNLTEEHIKQVLNGGTLQILNKKDGPFKYNVPLPLQDDALMQDEYFYLKNSFLEGAPVGYEHLTRDSSSVRYRGVNITPIFWVRAILQLKLYGQFFGGRIDVLDDMFVVSPDAKEMFNRDKNSVDVWKKRYMRSYERKIKSPSFEVFGTRMLQDFADTYGVEVIWEPLTLKGWEFHKNSDHNIVYPPSGINKQRVKIADGNVLFDHATIPDFIKCLIMLKTNYGYYSINFNEHIFINGSIKMEDIFSWENLNDFLMKQGIGIKEVRIDKERLKIKQKSK